MQLGSMFNPLNAKLNPICHLLALLGAHHILHVSSIRVNNCNNALHVSDAICVHLQEHLKTVVTASGVRHEKG
jgi:hypothetical protein